MKYPPVSFFYRVTFNGIGKKSVDTQFQSIAGLSVEMQTESKKEGGENRFEHILPLGTRYDNLVLKRGLITDSDLINWVMETFENTVIQPVSLDISLLNEKADPLMNWNVVHVWPKKWSITDLNAEKSAITIETLELNYRLFSVSTIN